jgi:predicted GTPase
LTIACLQETKEGADAPLDLHLKLLFLGKTGVGKSATINSIFQQPLQTANGFEPETKDIRILDVNMYGVKITVIDTPGLSLGDG